MLYHCSEDQARSLLTNDRTSTGDPTCGNILNSVGTMEFNQSNDQLSVTFRNMVSKRRALHCIEGRCKVFILHDAAVDFIHVVIGHSKTNSDPV